MKCKFRTNKFARGKFTDPFACNITKNATKFFTRWECPNSAGINALGRDWGNNAWVVPPFSLLDRTISCLIENGQHAMLYGKNGKFVEQQTPNKPRLWWTWRNGKFVEQHMGQNQIAVVAKKVAMFLKKDPHTVCFTLFPPIRGHGSMIEGGASTDQLMVSGGWGSQTNCTWLCARF